MKTPSLCHILRNVIVDVLTQRYLICKTTIGVSIILHSVISLPDRDVMWQSQYIY